MPRSNQQKVRTPTGYNRSKGAGGPTLVPAAILTPFLLPLGSALPPGFTERFSNAIVARVGGELINPPGSPLQIPGTIPVAVETASIEAGADIVVRAPAPLPAPMTINVALDSKTVNANDPNLTDFNLAVTGTFGPVGLLGAVAVYIRNPTAGTYGFAGNVVVALAGAV